VIGSPIARHTLVVVRAPEVSDGRRMIYDWPNATRTDSPGWALDAGDTSADTAQREGGSIEYTARGPYDADVLQTDRIEALGATYLIDGAVVRQPGPIPAVSHTILRLVRWVG
jgi:hypothetical protein